MGIRGGGGYRERGAGGRGIWGGGSFSPVNWVVVHIYLNTPECKQKALTASWPR